MWSFLFSLCAIGATLDVTVAIEASGPRLVDAVVLDRQAPARIGGGAIEILDGAGQIVTSGAVPDAQMRSVIYPEGGGDVGWVDEAWTRVTLPWPDGAQAVRLGGREIIPSFVTPGLRQIQDADPVHFSGLSEDRLDLVFLADGYTEDQLDQFNDDVADVVSYMLALEPYNRYTGLFNIWSVFAASEQQGVSQFGDAPHSESAYGCHYGCTGIDRLICCDDAKVVSAVSEVLPAAEGIMVLINEERYGGSGGAEYGTAYVGSEGVLVAAHELGHTLVGLWDEYVYTGVEGIIDFAPNCSTDPEPRWEHWIDDEGDIDVYEGCSYTDASRPTNNGCIMRTLQDGYCSVCREWVVHSIYGNLGSSLIQSISPEPSTELKPKGNQVIEFEIDSVGPDEGLVHEWALDGVVFAENDPDFRLDECSDLKGTLSLTLRDPTDWIRDDPYNHTFETVAWDVSTRKCGGCSATGTLPLVGTGALTLLGLLLLPWRRRR